MNEQRGLPHRVVAAGVARCIADSVRMLVGRRVHLRTDHVGMRLGFADGTSAQVYRETVVDRGPTEDPCVLVVEFRLRAIHGRRAHSLFRGESLLNTPLFIGFPGFVSKLWLANDERDVYRGVYEWDGAELAEHYARCLWRVLELVCVRGSIQFRVLPGLHRDVLLDEPQELRVAATEDEQAWWRLIEVA